MAVGIGSFGPVELNAASPQYGHITSTPKPGWQNIDLAGEVARALAVPVAFDTDVNAAALGEQRWGAAREVATCVYLDNRHGNWRRHAHPRSHPFRDGPYADTARSYS